MNNYSLQIGGSTGGSNSDVSSVDVSIGNISNGGGDEDDSNTLSSQLLIVYVISSLFYCKYIKCFNYNVPSLTFVIFVSFVNVNSFM